MDRLEFVLDQACKDNDKRSRAASCRIHTSQVNRYVTLTNNLKLTQRQRQKINSDRANYFLAPPANNLEPTRPELHNRKPQDQNGQEP